MFFRGKHDIKGLFTLDITNGVGTTEQDVRFLANAEVVLYRLKHHNMEAVGS
jgi:predicted MPP superfamily phosphohydrolase